ncbi:SIR2 family protein [uncultured Brevundimonas sp.]|uniref:SIR2 family protein n=1 Tax=uncultured Brevundimonas sp. TaxID=213418 RepID=UPI0030EBE6F2|tara:strand:- start:1422 stop:2285 length:864 start_codon:yes stop_codon:yes gene_type:complete
MTPKWPDALIDAVARRRAVILIGSGISANAAADNGSRPPTWGQFLKKAYGDLGKSHKHIAAALKRFDYLEACDYLKSEHGKEAWNQLIRTTFVTPGFRTADIHKHIFNLDCRIVASLNFDKIYETYAIPASENTLVIKNYYDADVRQAVAGTDRYLIKPHGTVDTMSKMIFTLEDYAKARVEHAAFYEIMTALLHTHTFLCVGCGLSDPDMKLIFEDYRYKHSESPHYIVLPSPFAKQQADLLQKTRGLNVIQYSPKADHAELTKELEQLGILASARREQIAEFLSW